MDCIAAIATPLAPSAIGILRLSGRGAPEIAGRIFAPKNGRPLEEQMPRTMVYGAVSDRDGKLLDDGLAVVFPAERSFTGETAVELYCHGSPVVLQETLGAVLAVGARLAQPGEFTKRAFLSGRMDLTQAESVMDIIDAETAEAARLAAAQGAGALRREVETVYDGLLALASQFYAVVDYPDEDIEDLSRADILAALDMAAERLCRLLATCRRGQIIRHGLPTALIGKPNVGKSSLLNALTGMDRALVTATAGTTRDTVEEKVRLGGVTLRLIDTAGIRETGDEIEEMGVERAKKAAAQAALALFVVDGSAPPDGEDEAAWSAAQTAERVVVVYNKADLPQNAGIAQRFPDGAAVSAWTGAGLTVLEETVAALFPGGDVSGGCLLTNTRQEDAARRANAAVARAREAFTSGLTADAILTDVEEAMSALGELTGRTAREDIVSRIFERFCVGK